MCGVIEYTFLIHRLFFSPDGCKKFNHKLKILFSTIFPMFSEKTAASLAIMGSACLAIGATPLQIFSTYNVFRVYTEKMYRMLEYIKEPFVLLIAAGIAMTRVALCVAYVQNKNLVPFLSVGVAFSFFSIYCWAMNVLFDSFTDAGKKRSVIAKKFTGEMNRELSEYKTKKSDLAESESAA